MKFTVITVTYNCDEVIEKTIKSIISQKDVDLEYIIIDGNSTDNTLDIIMKYKLCITQIISENDDGIYNAMNKGVSIAKGEYILFINAGDILVDESVMNNIEKNICCSMDSVIYYGNYYLPMNDKNLKLIDFSKERGTFTEKVLSGNMPCHQVVVTPKAALREHYFNEKYVLRADYEWICHSLTRGYSFQHIEVNICVFDNMGISSNDKNSELMVKETNEILDRYATCIQNQSNQDYSSDSLVQMVNKNGLLFITAIKWIVCLQKKYDITQYLIKNKYKTVAIYGYSFLGERLEYELINKDIEIRYIVDQNNGCISETTEIRDPKDISDDIDVMIITPVFYFQSIKRNIQDMLSCPIISLVDLFDI